MSHPTRVRGLKPKLSTEEFATLMVAPHAGAWIETDKCTCGRWKGVVAPHAGAWIETIVWGQGLDDIKSHPTRVRGLKQNGQRTRQPLRRRTPRGCVD